MGGINLKLLPALSFFSFLPSFSFFSLGAKKTSMLSEAAKVQPSIKLEVGLPKNKTKKTTKTQSKRGHACICASWASIPRWEPRRSLSPV